MKELNTDFGGVQDHKINGGQDVYSIGYSEFIGPLTKAIQELSGKNDKLEQENKDLNEKLNTLLQRLNITDL